jgi:large repetitive protein
MTHIKRWNVSGCALISCVAAASLAACTLRQAQGDTPAIEMPSGAADIIPSTSHHKAFYFTGNAQSFVVPNGVTQITVVASGASGAIVHTAKCNQIGGTGGLVQATIPVTPNETLAVFVGGEGEIGGGCLDYEGYGDGGFNGGGNGGISGYDVGSPHNYSGGGGGGASDVRQGGSALANRVVVAAGGGGGGGLASSQKTGGGGAGGGKSGGRGTGGHSGSGGCLGSGGLGGTPSKGGNGGGGAPQANPGSPGALGLGGGGGSGASDTSAADGGGGGGGGGGYYGGGGGGAGAKCKSLGGGGGGGGGSSYVEPGATNVKDEKGAGSSGNGQITISW